jgi:two-component system chemotaxis response regulator CheY
MDSDILVVDDSAAIRKILTRVLRQTGMAIQTIHEAGDGQDALAVMAQHRVDLVLSDINMPKMDGLQLLASLKASPQWHSIPVVMITTEGGETKVAEAVRLGAAGYVAKPFTADQIRRSWWEFCSRRQRYERSRQYCRIPHPIGQGRFLDHAGQRTVRGRSHRRNHCFRTERRCRLLYWHRRKLGRYRKLDLLTGNGLPYLYRHAHDRGSLSQ